ncbi:hypothetical protein [uncultured Psychrobacter sp.]|uniref:hypothetical protein n=1 Tax=uncultured Psychrobacter sp. TaxID=259303 RepID=UPI0026085F43|nr:hypothetical protein [uncultured Psychrobacter sp.]
MQAQSEAFNQSLQAHDERYERLFDQTRFPNSDSQAKRHLISAIRQHLATDHVAVAQANYNAVPFIDADSIDAGSTGLLRTILEVYGHREAQENDDYENHSDYDYDDYDNYNDYESHNETAADAVSAAATIMTGLMRRAMTKKAMITTVKPQRVITMAAAILACARV